MRVIVVTGAGRAFCAGMDLSVVGNVFGLDEDFKPTMEDMNHRLEDSKMIEGGRVTLAIYGCKKPDRMLFLAVPLEIYNDFFDDDFIKEVVEEYHVKILVYNIENETIEQWIN